VGCCAARAFVQVDTMTGYLMSEESMSGYLSKDRNAEFFRCFAAQFPETLDVLCLGANQRDCNEVKEIEKLREAIRFLCLCSNSASEMVIPPASYVN
jgi:hypothetical protein